MNKSEIIILGAGGHSKGVIESILAQGVYSIRGLTAPANETSTEHVLGYSILGDDSLIPSLLSSGLDHFIVGLGGVGNNAPRRRLYELGITSGLTPVSTIHSAALVSESCSIASGTVVFSGAIIAADSCIGHNVIINHGAIVEHDCIVDDHVHIATGACLAGMVHVGCSAHIGAGATILQGIVVGENAIVAAGAVVAKDVNAGSMVRGVPAK